MIKPNQVEVRRTFPVHVYPYVKMYLKKTKMLRAEVFNCEEYTSFGKLVTLALTDKRSWKESIGSVDKLHLDRPTELIRIKLTTEQSRMSPQAHKLQRLAVDLDRMFKEDLMKWITAQGALGVSVRSACISFIEYYDLEKHGFNLDNAYKHWQRSKQ